MKKEIEKADLKLNIQKMKITASSPITSWQIDSETMETGTDFIFLGSKITSDGYCSYEMKRRLLLERKVMAKPAAATAKSLQSCDSVQPHRPQPTRLPCP